MFSVREIEAALAESFGPDYELVREAQSCLRLGQEVVLETARRERLSHLVDSVLGSIHAWDGEGARVAAIAGECAELLAETDGDEAERRRLQASILYELGGRPAMAIALRPEEPGQDLLQAFFGRLGAFGSLSTPIEVPDVNGSDEVDFDRVLRFALSDEALALAQFQHEPDAPSPVHGEGAEELARVLSSGIGLGEAKAFGSVVQRRAEHAVATRVSRPLLERLRAIGFPPELWDAQVKAIEDGLLEHDYDSWGLAAPTGSGKTFLARLLILDLQERQPEGRILYLVPTRALVYEVERELKRGLSSAGIEVSAITPHLVALGAEDDEQIQGAQVLVLTPEKADLLLRVGWKALSEVRLVVVDEAHHIEEGTRGVLLELYLSRLRLRMADSARYVFLSAVAPNIAELSGWMGENPGSSLVTDRATRMRVGTFRLRTEGGRRGGYIDYTDGIQVRVLDAPVTTKKRGIAQLAIAVSNPGPVLVVCEGRGTAETIASNVLEQLQENSRGTPLGREALGSAVMRRLDARLEREMYPEVMLRKLIRHGISYHHAGLPPRVREALEDAISAGHIHYVIGTTTLGAGVNMPFSSVIVQSVAYRESSFEPGVPLSWRIFTPRNFWNIAGRAGRPGMDHEGQVILFEPALNAEQVESIEPYLTPDLKSIPDVTSALSDGIHEISEAVDTGGFELDDLARVQLDEKKVPKQARGVINLLRVGLAHAEAENPQFSAATYLEATLAVTTMNQGDQEFAERLLDQQQDVLREFLESPSAPPIDLVAELGLSIDTLSRLRQWVFDLVDWQFAKLVKDLMYGPALNLDQAPFLFGPVLKRMTELEGRRTHGWTSQLVVDWCGGKPFSAIPFTKKLEVLITLIYRDIQYQLPWALWAVDRFVEERALQEGVAYSNEIQMVAHLASAGVPDYAALRLTMLDFERVDAARLSRAYLSDSLARDTTQIEDWIRAQDVQWLTEIVRGRDRRRLDYDFKRLVASMGGPAEDESYAAG